MTYSIVLLWLFGALFAAYLLFQGWRQLRERRLQRRLAAMPFPAEWRAELQRIPHYNALNTEARARVERAVLHFIYTRSFRGIGLEVTEAMKLPVAFYAALMTPGGEDDRFAPLAEILYYARGFVAEESVNDGGIVSSGEYELDGQSSIDTIALSWEDTAYESHTLTPDNIIVHELAHVLDFLEGERDTAWLEAFERTYDACRDAAGADETSMLWELFDDYAFSNETEFFAVSSERFFQSPDRLHADHPGLFGLLRHFYGVDPREWGVEAPYDAPCDRDTHAAF